jgi:DNA-binding MarR family transcriptional regulator
VQVSRAVETLMRAKRVARSEDATDGRILRLSLTAKGRAIYDEVVPLALHLEDVFLSALKPEERRQFDALMAKLARQAHLLGGTDK